MRAPDGIVPLVGYRAWVAATDRQGRPVLRSILRQVDWPSASRLQALCVGPHVPEGVAEHGARDAPHPACTCGIYCLKAPELRRWCLRQPETVAPGFLTLGMVAGSGRFLEGAEGYRVQFARPIALLSDPVFPASRPEEGRSRLSFQGSEPQIDTAGRWIAAAAAAYGIPVITAWPRPEEIVFRSDAA